MSLWQSLREAFSPSLDGMYEKFRKDCPGWVRKAGWPADGWAFEQHSLRELHDSLDRSADRKVWIPLLFSYEKKTVFPHTLFLAVAPGKDKFVACPVTTVGDRQEWMNLEIGVLLPVPCPAPAKFEDDAWETGHPPLAAALQPRDKQGQQYT